jgi:hypothetical protein
MRKATRHYILDAIEGLILLASFITGFILWFVLPGGDWGGAGPHGGGATFLFNRHVWIEIHKWLAVALLVAFSTHIATHRQWITHMTKSYFKRGKEIKSN